MAFVGGAVTVALVSSPIALIGDAVAHIRGPVPLIGGPLASAGGPLARSEDILSPVQGRLAPGQPGPRGRQRVLGLPSARLSGPHPDVIQGLGRDPLPLHLLTTSWATSASLREDARACPRSWWNAGSRLTPWVAATIPLACSIHTRLASACRS